MIIDNVSDQQQEFSWPYWPILPLYPFGKRRTIRQEIIKDSVWTFDQIQGILYVVVPIRMTVVKLAKGGLLVYAPIAPTMECIRLIRELEVKHGAVKFIILPTSSGLEHKVFVGPFARYFKTAEVFVVPKQWSFPINLPLSWLGLPSSRTRFLPQNCSEAPFGDEFEYEILPPINLRLGWFSEVAFYHRLSRSLLVTDLIISIGEKPPAIVNLDPYPLLFHAREQASDPILDNYQNRLIGWQRIILFALFFRPFSVDIIGWGDTLKNAFKSPDRTSKTFFGLYPFKWLNNWQKSLEAIVGEDRLLVAPVLQSLILNRAPESTLTWVNNVSNWQFQRIIPCHFNEVVSTTPEKFKQAFAFLESADDSPPSDYQLLQTIDRKLNQIGILPPAKHHQ